jgi:transposase
MAVCCDNYHEGGKTMEEIYAGIDVHRDYGVACVQNPKGETIDEFRFRNDVEGINEAKARLGKSNAHVAIESTGNMWVVLWDKLEESGLDLHLVHPLKTKAIASNKLKNDKLDAKMLAKLLRGDMLVCSYVPPRDVRDEREKVRLRGSLVRMRTQVVNKIRSILHKYCIKYKGSLHQNAGMEFLRTLELRPVDTLAIKSYLETLKTLNDEIESVNSQIANNDSEEIRLLMSIPGIDYYSAVLIFSEIGDISRFPSHNKLASWAGLVPSMHQSGTSFYNGRITKEGSRRLRWILIQCAHTAIRANSKLNEFYSNIAKRRGDNKAVVAVARKLVKIIYAVLSSRSPSLYGDPEKTERKIKRMKKIAEKVA